MGLWVYDVETPPTNFVVTFMRYEDGVHKTFEIDDDTGKNDRKEIIEFVKGQTLVGYNSATFDNLILNYIIKHSNVSANQLHRMANEIIGGQKKENFNLYKVFKPYLNSELYNSIDLMRLLFSKKLRVGLKELECSLNFKNVEELPYAHDKILTKEEKEKVISYNINDCEATRLVLEKSMDALRLRRWIKKTYGVDTFSTDSVNSGIKILGALYEKAIGNNQFRQERTFREWIHIKDIILPVVKFETKAFNDVLDIYKKHTWYSSHYDEELFEDSKLKFEPLINGFKFKFSLGGLHGYTQSKVWESNDEYDIMSVDVASYYPSLVLMWGFVPEHLNKDTFLRLYSQVKEERLAAKAAGDKLKDTTLKFCINGTFGMFGNRYSWLFDHKVRLQICVNGQLLLAMLIEKFFQEGIELIDANTDGVYVKVHKSKKERFEEIIKWWESVTKMTMDRTKFEKLWFVNTADYFGTTYELDKKTGKQVLKTKEKGMFLSELQLGKGMEFPVIANSVKKHFLEGIDFRDYIMKHDNILDFCSYKKLSKEFECFHNGEKQQRVNRFYACKSGAYLFKRKFDQKKQKYQTDNVLKDSPVALFNKIDDIPIQERNLNYPFYLSKAREIINAIESKQESLF